jgi:hypothetical protein
VKIETQTQVLMARFVANLLKNNALSFIFGGFYSIFSGFLCCFVVF